MTQQSEYERAQEHLPRGPYDDDDELTEAELEDMAERRLEIAIEKADRKRQAKLW